MRYNCATDYVRIWSKANGGSEDNYKQKKRI